MNYGVPYKGSKNRIVKVLSEAIPKADVFCDLFAGGCAVTHRMMELGKSGRYIANENGRAAWKSLGIQRKMGECVFWHCIVPKLKKVQDEVGCQYVYLFAADSSLDGDLANYYKVALHFEQSATLGANKPQYDFQCFFLCQELNKLLKHREAFYEYFNPDNTDWV